jgi:dihydroxyacid dehydratase/phosphogluconate dehydratase
MPSGIPNAEKNRVRQLFAEGKVDRGALLEVEARSYHAPGTCTFYGAANTNQMLPEFMGLPWPRKHWRLRAEAASPRARRVEQGVCRTRRHREARAALTRRLQLTRAEYLTSTDNRALDFSGNDADRFE